ncbi:MAG TPA: hypothetical protein EYH34_02470, partial [Planctomycetes bacterium]|nr:hypothetical protein [Planctomycetota bacterium]
MIALGADSRARFTVLLLIGGALVWIFADALWGDGVLAYRDAGHFYYPLFRFVRHEWAAGRVPLWNPYENLGTPLAGNAAASVFYPGQLVFWLPVEYRFQYNIYIVLHLVLAAWGAYWLARKWGASVTGAGVAAASYALCGNVLFQYCNVIFLVGAAWLPWAMGAAARTLVQRSMGWAAGLGVTLALMTLGGSPEMAYHAGLLAASYALWLWWFGQRGSGQRGSGRRG